MAIVAMSGGVDSSVSAALLHRDGWDVTGVYFHLQSCGEPSGSRSCCGIDGAVRARAVASYLGIPLHIQDCRREFEEKVLEPAWREYSAGRTPNPCISCNEKIKFRLLKEMAVSRGAAKFATGHYAGIRKRGGGNVLIRGADRGKDQSYFLFSLDREQLSSVLFPLEDLTKEEVRATAERMGLPGWDAPESQDACLGSDGASFAESLRERFRAAASPGPVLEDSGELLGSHAGIHLFTIGQRRGLGFGLGRKAWVKEIDTPSSRIVVTADRNGLLSDGLVVSNVRWNSGYRDSPVSECLVQIRYRHPAARAKLAVNEKETVTALFDEPQSAVAPGQAAVFYENDALIGGGVIERGISNRSGHEKACIRSEPNHGGEHE